LVYVFDTEALTDIDHYGVPYICLPCRSDELTREGERHRATAEAVHEATHVFNCREHPFRPLEPDLTLWRRAESWLWAHEAMAIFMERVVIPENHDFHRFLKNWVDVPATSLDSWNGRYEAAMFLCYLSARFGPHFVNDIWTKFPNNEEPLATIEHLIDLEGQKFCSAHPDDDDVFASGYNLDSYFLWHPSSISYEPHIFDRYHERMSSWSFELSVNQEISATGELDHLACSYYRFYLDSSITELKVQLLTEEVNGKTPLKAELAMVARDLRRDQVHRLCAVPAAASNHAVQLARQIPGLDQKDVDHIVLVVSNCGLRRRQENRLVEHDDGKEYRLTVTAH
jgi:hypothetical protein